MQRRLGAHVADSAKGLDETNPLRDAGTKATRAIRSRYPDTGESGEAYEIEAFTARSNP